MPQFSDDLLLGPVPVEIPMVNTDGTTYIDPSPMSTGIGPMGRVYVFDVVPVTASTTNVINVAAVAGAGALTPNGSLYSSSLGYAKVDERFGRCLRAVSSDVGDTAQTVTIAGYDCYMQPMTETRTLNGTTSVSFTKAFWKITTVTVSAVMVGTLSVGTRDALGLPIRVNDAGYVVSAGWANALARDAGTLTVADATTATAATNDVRGIYVPSSASNSSRRLVMSIACTAIQAGPNATRAGAYGVTQA